LERIDQYRVYELASGLRPISALTMQSEPFAIAMTIVDAKRAIASCLKEDQCLFQSSKNAAQGLVQLIDAIWEECFLDRETRQVRMPEDDKNKNWRNFLFDLWRAVNKLETLLAQDFATQATFSAPRRSIYDTEYLVNSADQAIPQALAPALSQMAATDLVNAGRCLAFGLYTAAGFHVCRAVEGVLEDYYRNFCGKTSTLKSWNDYIEALRKVAAANDVKPELKPQPETIAYLDAIRKYNRNEIAHPRVVLDEAEAITVFDLGKAVMCAMARELLAAGATVVPPTKARARGIAAAVLAGADEPNS
jgi:hypothetical protein